MSEAIDWARYGRQAQLAGQHALSLYAYDIAIKAGADTAATWLGYAIALAQTNHGETALAAFKKSLDKDGKQVDAWCMMGELALDLKRYTLAVEAFEKCHALDPKAETPHGARAKALARRAFKTLA